MSDFAASEDKPTGWRDRMRVDGATIPEKVVPFALGGGTVGALAAAGGGYFPPAWGWSSLALLWVAAAGLVVSRGVTLERADLTLVGALLALLAWTALSVVWSGSETSTILEVQRLVVYVAAAAAALLVVRRQTVPVFVGGVLLGITAVSSYALATRLVPGRFGAYDSLEGGYRLAEPLGYWNALGILAALGILLAGGLAARAVPLAARALAGASVAILAPTLFFTFSRGAWIALGLGIVAMVALDARRLQLATTLLAVAPAAVVTVWLGSRADALTAAGAPLAEASRDGRRLVAYVVILAVLSAGLVLAAAYSERHVRVTRRVRLACAGGLVLVVVLALVAASVAYGSPASIARKAWAQVHAPAPTSEGELTGRLFSLSANGRLELASVALDDFAESPIAGSGAGTYERYWLQHRDIPGKVRDAHSLYLEVLAELGVIGLVLLLVALAVPLAAAVRARRRPLVSAALGAYVAYLAHAGIDWDWEMTAVTVAALFCGVAVIVEARRREEDATPRAVPFPVAALGGVALLAAFSFVGLIGNVSLSRGEGALAALQYEKAVSEARRASTWAPWSSEPWRLLGEAQLAAGEITAARASLRSAVSEDPDDWKLWLSLALATEGEEQEQALAEAKRLNPLSGQVRQIEESLGP